MTTWPGTDTVSSWKPDELAPLSWGSELMPSTMGYKMAVETPRVTKALATDSDCIVGSQWKLGPLKELMKGNL